MSLVPYVKPDRPGRPTCGHTDREQELARFPGTSQNSTTSVSLVYTITNLMVKYYTSSATLLYSDKPAHTFIQNVAKSNWFEYVSIALRDPNC